MITELEEQFFKVFGIEPKIKDGCKYADNYWNNEKLANLYGTFDAYLKEKCPYENKECYTICSYAYDKEVYPEITNDILLQMICINSQKGGIEIFNRKNTEELKNSMLQYCIDRLGYALNKEQYKTKIQQLFKEEE